MEPSPNSKSSTIPAHQQKVSMNTLKAELELAVAFIFFSILGNYSRLGLTKLTDYSGSYVQSPTVLWANLAACFIMGLMQTMFHYKVFNPLMFTAITTGYCGALSSYSSLIVEIFIHAANQTSSTAHAFPNRAYGIMEFLAVLLVQILVSMCSHIFGLYVAKEFATYFENFETKELSLAARRTHRIFTIIGKVVLVISLPVLIIQIVLAAVYNNSSRYWTLSAIFAFPGTMLRYILSKQLNSKIKHFPLGTFTANVLGTLLLAIFTLLTRGKRQDGSAIIQSSTTDAVVIALGNGFCGCLTTVSTFINECHRLPLRNTMIYYFFSIFVSFSLVVVTLGSYAWTRGLE
ncbi:LANO_0A03906g1_1 [Lachancea nothofagi CBS 11611]|uniref:LANO_0A03906g1_1 n=1 Tax=Lachancea nothofagi CBS 11611 TaxID=1266666 RepID=A0A1G4IPT2_9SACH|nr:LANO_0A03906g1_1 [Lachancea nothofagi CBS 11611]